METAETNRTISPLMLFAALLLAGGLIVVSQIDDMIERTITSIELKVRNSVPQIGGAAFWTRLECELDRLADPAHALSAEQRQKLLSKVRAIRAQWGPFATELYAAVTGSEEPAPKKPGQ